MENYTEQKDLQYLKAKRSVKKKKAFYIHLLIFITVNLMELFIKINGEQPIKPNEYITRGIWTFFLIFQGIGAFVPDFFLGSKWEDRKIQELMTKNKQNG